MGTPIRAKVTYQIEPHPTRTHTLGSPATRCVCVCVSPQLPQPVMAVEPCESGDYFVGTDSDFERWLVQRVERAVTAKAAASPLHPQRAPPASPELSAEREAPAGSQDRTDRVPASSLDRHSIAEILNDEPQGMKRELSGRLKEARDRAEANGASRDASVHANGDDEVEIEAASRKESRHELAPFAPQAVVLSDNTRSRKDASDDEITVLQPEHVPEVVAAKSLGSLAGGSRAHSEPSLPPLPAVQKVSFDGHCILLRYDALTCML